jgi:hypothetical protein
VRVEKRAGQTVDPDSFAVGQAFYDDATNSSAVGAAIATDHGFLYAEAYCAEPGAGSTLSIIAIPESGEPSAPQVLPLERIWCSKWASPPAGFEGKMKYVRTASALYLVVGLSLFEILPNDVVRPIAYNIPSSLSSQDLDVVAAGSKLAFASRDYSQITTLRIDPSDPSATVVGVSAMSSPGSGLALTAPQGRLIVSWVEAADDNGGYSLRWASVDDSGKVEAPQTIVVTGTGEIGDVQVASDDRGLASLYARRTFPSDPFELALRRFDPSQVTMQDSDDVRIIATDITTLGHALTRAGEGQWLATYAKHGDIFTDWGTPSSRVYGRFVYESAAH